MKGRNVKQKKRRGGLKRRLTKGRNAGDQTPAEGALIMLLSVRLWSFVGFFILVVCVCVC